MVDFDDAKNLKKQADDKSWTEEAESQMRDRMGDKNKQDDQRDERDNRPGQIYNPDPQ